MPPKKTAATRKLSKKKATASKRSQRLVRILVIAFLVLITGYSGLLLVGCAVSNRLIFHPPEPSYTADAPGLVKLPLKTGGEIPAFWTETPGAKWTVIYFHGNAMDIGHSRQSVSFLQKQGCSVLTVEYPGYGPDARSAPSEEGCYAAADSAYDYLRTTRGIPAGRIALYGFSLGTGVATELASRQPVGALILEAPFLSTFRVVTKVKVVPLDRFDSLAKIGKVKCPLFVIHGTADNIVPYSHGTALFAAAGAAVRKQFYKVEGGSHINLTSQEKSRKAIAAFLAASE
ncbi:MAG: alpha/beta hydrolase [Puniceicoccales bacterium]|jgi:pimeloyl-ACP methyl ester carboxylesterase|nr:alpha/beta hydrolase [Puniceicoccales bacterium]